MPICTFTAAFIEEITSHLPDKRTIYHDSEIRGFSLDMRPNGSGTWFFQPDKGSMRHSLGRVSDTDVSEARNRAYDLFRQSESGKTIETLRFRILAGKPFREFVDTLYVRYAMANKRSWPMERRLLRTRIVPSFGLRRMDRISAIDIQTWLQSMVAEGLAPATCNRPMALLRCIFQKACEWGVLDVNPCRTVRDIPGNGTRTRFLSVSEFRALLAHTAAGGQAYTIIRLLALTGARKSEILNARWEYVDLERRQLTVPLSKNGETRHIVLSDEALAIIASIPRTGSPWLFPGRFGDRPIVSVAGPWTQLRRELGLMDVHLHDLRHTFASFLANAGHSLYEIGQILGHKDLRTTRRYAHLVNGTLIDAVNDVARIVREPDSPRTACSGMPTSENCAVSLNFHANT